MAERPNTVRTKRVISVWADEDVKNITLDTILDRLVGDRRDRLRSDLNKEFSGEGAFPILPSEWDNDKLKRVKDVRDLVDKKNPTG